LYTVYRPGNIIGCEGRGRAISCWHCRQIIEARDHDADPSEERGRQAYATTLLSSVKRLKDATSYSKERGMGDRCGEPTLHGGRPLLPRLRFLRLAHAPAISRRCTCNASPTKWGGGRRPEGIIAYKCIPGLMTPPPATQAPPLASEGRKRESLALGDAAVTRQMVSDVRPFAGR
jgi:hypothetical protein